MRIKFKKLPPGILNLVRRVGEEAQELGLTAYVVGGFVRDLLLNRPNEDVDVVVEGDALALAQVLGKKFKARVTFYREFGTATVHLNDGLRLDLSSARKELYPYPGALPVVSPGTLADDLFRRDFTINAMAASIAPARFGEVQDFYGGIQDLRQGKVRVLHEQSFWDDPTRIIRAIRFEQRFGFSIEKKTLQLLKQALQKSADANVKPGRYFEAFRKVFSEPVPFCCFQRMTALRAWRFLGKGFYPDVRLLRRISARIQTLQEEKVYAPYDWAPVLMLALLDPLSLQQRKNMASRLPFTQMERQTLVSGASLARIERKLQKPGLKPSQVYGILNDLSAVLFLFLRVRTQDPRAIVLLDRYERSWRHVTSSLTGHDLQRMGIPAGPQLGKILRMLVLKKMDGEITTPAQERRAVQTVAKRV